MIVASSCRARSPCGRRVRVGDVLAETGEVVQTAAVHRPVLTEVREVRCDARDPAGVLLLLDDDRDGLGVGEDPADLVGGAGLVDRDGDEAGGPHREVDQRPLEAGAGQDRHVRPGSRPAATKPFAMARTRARVSAAVIGVQVSPCRSARIGRSGVSRARSVSRRAAEPWSGATGPALGRAACLPAGVADGDASAGAAADRVVGSVLVAVASCSAAALVRRSGR